MGQPVALQELVAARHVWHGRNARPVGHGVPTGVAELDDVLPLGGWPKAALTELLVPADGLGEIALLLPTLARLTQAGQRVVLIAPPYIPYAPAWRAGGVQLRFLEIVEAEPKAWPAFRRSYPVLVHPLPPQRKRAPERREADESQSSTHQPLRGRYVAALHHRS